MSCLQDVGGAPGAEGSPRGRRALGSIVDEDELAGRGSFRRDGLRNGGLGC